MAEGAPAPEYPTRSLDAAGTLVPLDEIEAADERQPSDSDGEELAAREVPRFPALRRGCVGLSSAALSGMAVPRFRLVGAALLLALPACDARRTTAPDPAPMVVRLVVEPAEDTLAVHRSTMFRATAYDEADRPVPDAEVHWSSSDPEVVVVDYLGIARGVGPGEAQIRAAIADVHATAKLIVEPAPEVEDSTLLETRALWVTRWDWSTAQGIREVVQGAARAGFNTLYFQVRARADAYYDSSLEPWAASLTGMLGEDPGWDPLAVAAAEARSHGLSLHAWVNAFIGWCGSAPPPPSEPPHAFQAHTDWAMVDAAGVPMPYGSGCRWLTPGHPGVRTRLGAVAADIARSYGVDGVHLDFIRYPDPSWSYDAASLASYDSARAAEPALSFTEHRRRLVTRAVRETRDSLRVAAPSATLSAAVWGIYRNERGWSGVSTGYDDRLQDARAWAEEGLVDALVPMVYWTIKPGYGDRLDFAWLADDHSAAVDSRHVYIGSSAEHIGLPELIRQIERSRVAGADGVSILSARLLAERDWWDALARGPFHRPATPGPMPWR